MTVKPITLADADKSIAEAKDPYAPQEYLGIYRIEEVLTVALPPEQCALLQVPVDDPDFKVAYPEGVPTLKIVRSGVDAFFQPDNLQVTYLPYYYFAANDKENWGKQMGDRKQAMVVASAIERVLGIRPFGSANQQKLKGLVAWWGQAINHYDFVQENGQRREGYSKWNVPRQLLPADFKYDGVVRQIAARADRAGGATSVAATVLSEAEQFDAIVAALAGKASVDRDAANNAVLETKGLSAEWYNLASEGEPVSRLAYAKGLITVVDGVITAVPVERRGAAAADAAARMAAAAVPA